MSKDIRWEQRFSNYKKAFSQLQKFVDKGNLSELEKQGIIKAFEYTFELAWNVLKDFLENRGQTGIYGSRDAIQKAFQLGLIEEGDNWMDMMKNRNRTSHTYNEETAEEISQSILSTYHKLFKRFKEDFDKLISKP